MSISFTITEKDCILDALRNYCNDLKVRGNYSRSDLVDGIYKTLLKEFL